MKSYNVSQEAIRAWDYDEIGKLLQVKLKGSDQSFDGRFVIPLDFDFSSSLVEVRIPNEVSAIINNESELGSPDLFELYILIEDIALRGFNTITNKIDLGEVFSSGKNLDVQVNISNLLDLFGFYEGLKVKCYATLKENRSSKYIIHDKCQMLFETTTEFRVRRENLVQFAGINLPFKWSPDYEGTIGFAPIHLEVSDQPIEKCFIIYGNSRIEDDIRSKWAKYKSSLLEHVALALTDLFIFILSNCRMDAAPTKNSAHAWLLEQCNELGLPFEKWANELNEQDSREYTRAKIQEEIQKISKIPEAYKNGE